jgi:hypothetical protein
MSCATAPVFWARQHRLPQPLQRFIRDRLEMALMNPDERSLFVWPTILGAPRMREAHPAGISEAELLSQAGRMLAALGVVDPAQAWRKTLVTFPDTAEKGATGWVPQRIWAPLSAPLSLRCGVILLALTGQPEDERYRLGSGVTLFNTALYHEAHHALESLWVQASGDLKKGLQGLILIAAGFYHQQHHDAIGMISLWQDALAALAPLEGELTTPWGTLDCAESLDAVEQRISWLRTLDAEAALDGLWEMPRPEWRLQ